MFDGGHFQPAEPHDFTIIRRAAPVQQAQQRRFARAVAANQADALASLHGEFGMIEQGMVSVSELDVAERDKSRGSHKKQFRVTGKMKMIPAMGPKQTPIVAGYNADARQAGQSRCQGIEEGPDSTEQGSG